MTESIRVLNDPALGGMENMARDEALLTLVGGGQSPPTLRLYEWSEPTVSLGYFQHYADYERLPAPAGDLAVVRRLTGGGAILHDLELTYSITLPTGHPLVRRSPRRLYELVHDALIALVGGRGSDVHYSAVDDGSGAAKGPFFCFARRHPIDVLIGEEKLAGSAQRRTRDAVLQHGSIIVTRRFHQQPAAEAQRAGLSVADLRAAMPPAIARATRQTPAHEEWRDEELTLAHDLSPKYAGEAWTRRR